MRALAVLTIFASLLSSTPTLAGEFNPEIRVASFTRLGAPELNLNLAELCGVVTGADNASVRLNVTVDPNTLNPGSYHTITGTNGRFCIVVHCTSGVAEIGFLGALHPKNVTAKIAD